MGRIHLTDRQWAFIQPLLPPAACTGRPRADDRRTIEGIVYILITGCRWQDLPREYGAPTTVWRRLKRWGEAGGWERLLRAALAALGQDNQVAWALGLPGRPLPASQEGGDQGCAAQEGERDQ